nr:hypothetical protein [Catenibacterium mitsuokai]
MQYGPTVDIETYRFASILGCHCVNKTILDEILSISDGIKAFYDVKEAFMALDDIDEKSAAEHDLEKRISQFLHMGQWKKNFKRPTRRKEQLHKEDTQQCQWL